MKEIIYVTARNFRGKWLEEYIDIEPEYVADYVYNIYEEYPFYYKYTTAQKISLVEQIFTQSMLHFKRVSDCRAEYGPIIH